MRKLERTLEYKSGKIKLLYIDKEYPDFKHFKIECDDEYPRNMTIRAVTGWKYFDPGFDLCWEDSYIPFDELESKFRYNITIQFDKKTYLFKDFIFGTVLYDDYDAHIYDRYRRYYLCTDSDFSINKQRYTGVVFDDFSLVYEDVESYVKYAKELGFKNVILAGHSLGSNKIIHYLGNTSDNFVNYFIVTSPVDLAYWFNVMPNIKKCINLAQKLAEDGREKEILPYLFGGFSPMSAEAVLSFYNAFNLKNCPVISGDGETTSLYNIKIDGAFVIGAKDSLTEGDPKGFMERINSCCKYPEHNTVIVVPDASHIFYGKHEEYAKTILDCIEHKFCFDSVL